MTIAYCWQALTSTNETNAGYRHNQPVTSIKAHTHDVSVSVRTATHARLAKITLYTSSAVAYLHYRHAQIATKIDARAYVQILQNCWRVTTGEEYSTEQRYTVKQQSCKWPVC